MKHTHPKTLQKHYNVFGTWVDLSVILIHIMTGKKRNEKNQKLAQQLCNNFTLKIQGIQGKH